MSASIPTSRSSYDQGEPGPDEPRFLCDVNVGKLARWLCLLGYDCAFMDPPRDADLIARARREGRAILTTDAGMVRAAGAHPAWLVRARDLPAQLKEVLAAFQLQPRPERLFSRCARCNAPVRRVAKRDAQGRVPPGAFEAHEEFFQCPSCGQWYWPGSHVERTRRRLKEMGILR